MAFDIANGAGPVSGGFFKPKEHASAHVILFEPKGVRPAVQTQYGPKDYVDGDFTIFLSQGELEQGAPSQVLENGTAEGNIGRSLAGYIGRMTAGKLGQVPTKKGNPAWTIEPVDSATISKLGEYLEKREASKKSQLPSFLGGTADVATDAPF